MNEHRLPACVTALAASLLAPFCAGQTPSPPPPPSNEMLTLQQGLVRMATHVLPSVVLVRSFVRGNADATPPPPPVAANEAPHGGWVVAAPGRSDYAGFRVHGQGSGFFVGGDDGELLTGLGPLLLADGNLADLVEVETYDGQHVLVDVVGIEPTLQLAVLRCAVFPSWSKPTMRPLQFGDSDALEVGSLLVGVGDPDGPERFLGTGLLVAKPSRDCYQELMSATYMQATMMVHPDALGGPLVDLDGNVVGMLCPDPATATGGVAASGSFSAWALPSKILSGLFESIRTAGTTRSPWLGFSVMSRAEIATTRGMQAWQAMDKPAHGILIENLFTPSPAAAAGVEPGDFLITFDDVEIHTPVDFQRQLYLAGVGRQVRLTFYRAGATLRQELPIEARPAAATPR